MILSFLIAAFSPLQVLRNARMLNELNKTMLLGIYLTGLPLRAIALVSFAQMVVEPMQRHHFPDSPESVGMALGAALIVLTVLCLKHWLSGVVFIALTVALLAVTTLKGFAALSSGMQFQLLFGYTALVSSHLAAPIFLQFDLIRRIALRVPKSSAEKIYSEDEDDDRLFEWKQHHAGMESYEDMSRHWYDNNR